MTETKKKSLFDSIIAKAKMMSVYYGRSLTVFPRKCLNIAFPFLNIFIYKFIIYKFITFIFVNKLLLTV